MEWSIVNCYRVASVNRFHYLFDVLFFYSTTCCLWPFLFHSALQYRPIFYGVSFFYLSPKLCQIFNEVHGLTERECRKFYGGFFFPVFKGNAGRRQHASAFLFFLFFFYCPWRGMRLRIWGDGVCVNCARRVMCDTPKQGRRSFLFTSLLIFFFTNFTYRRVLNRFWCLVPLKRVSDHSETHPTSFPPSSAELVPSCHQVDTGCVCECVWVFFFLVPSLDRAWSERGTWIEFGAAFQLQVVAAMPFLGHGRWWLGPAGSCRANYRSLTEPFARTAPAFHL